MSAIPFEFENEEERQMTINALHDARNMYRIFLVESGNRFIRKAEDVDALNKKADALIHRLRHA